VTRSIPENRKALTLADLRERLSSIEHRTSTHAPIPTGWDHAQDAREPRTRATFSALTRGTLHEWIGLESTTQTRRWSPPLMLLVHLACEAVAQAERESSALWFCWIGPRVWPSPSSLARARQDLLGRSLFVDATDAASRLWAVDLAARIPSVLVIADGTSFDMAASRRVLLATESVSASGGGGGWLAHLARPPWEAREPSAASTRWMVAREAAAGDEPRFRLRCLRSKGTAVVNESDSSFVLERTGRDRLVVVPAAVGDRSRAPTGACGPAHPDPALARRASA
jgi:hypothetical protein